MKEKMKETICNEVIKRYTSLPKSEVLKMYHSTVKPDDTRSIINFIFDFTDTSDEEVVKLSCSTPELVEKVKAERDNKARYAFCKWLTLV